jgi:Phage integrase SAM-like domain/Arm DNA-binding domain
LFLGCFVLHYVLHYFRIMNFTLNTIVRTDRPNNSGLCPIYVRYTFNRKFYNIPTELTISENHWNAKDGVFSKNFKERGNYNLLIGKIESEVRKVITDFKIAYERFPDAKELKDILQSDWKGKRNLKGYFDEFIKYKTEKNCEKSTLIVYNTTWKTWESFQKEEKNVFEVKDMTFATFDKFKTFCENEGKQNNTIGKYIKTFKTFLHYLESFHKVTLPVDFKNVKKPSNNSDFEIFTRKELEILKSSVFMSDIENVFEHKNYGLTYEEIIVGQMMVLMCSTGLSFVDFNKLTIDDIVFDKSDYGNQKGCYIKLTRTKLKQQEMCVIPILDITIELILINIGFTPMYGTAYALNMCAPTKLTT